jgi:hypothetical protein
MSEGVTDESVCFHGTKDNEFPDFFISNNFPKFVTP